MFMCDLVLSKTNLSYLETNFQTHQNQNVKYYFHDGSLEIYFECLFIYTNNFRNEKCHGYY